MDGFDYGRRGVTSKRGSTSGPALEVLERVSTRRDPGRVESALAQLSDG